jgi:capsular polysaccharide transport system permease protein
VRSMYSRESIDLVNRFPGPEWWDTSFEGLYRHYLRHVGVDYDTVSSITVLRVRAYAPKEARDVNQLLLDMGERLVNTMNMRSREDLIQVAEAEVRSAEQRSKSAAASLSAFRSSRSVVDPERQSALHLQSLARLREELLAATSQLAEVRAVSPNNPQIVVLSSRVQALQRAMSDENARILGPEGGLTSKSPDYDRLALEKTFADRQLAAALTTLDSARNEAARKQLYLERLVQPNLPDMALEPRRLRGVLTVLAVGLLLWGIVSLVVASVREHTD